MEEILRLFPKEMKLAIQSTIQNRWLNLQEIRFRLNQPIELIFDQHVEWIEYCKPTKYDSVFVLNQLSQHSLYRMEDELREGYMTIEGGHRVGLAGKVNTLGGAVKAVQHITFLNIRIAKQSIGVANPILPYLFQNDYLNTLVIGPPQSGKTTLIRDLTRLISTGRKNMSPKKVGVVDERSEIGASIKGVPQHDLGRRTDVLDACPKAEGMMMLIRSMSPEVIVVDEIGHKQDVKALLEAINAGVTIFCTIHGQSLSELKKRPSLKPIFDYHIFKRFIVMDRNLNGPGQIQKIYNEKEMNIFQKSGCLHNEVDWSSSFHKHNDLDWNGVEPKIIKTSRSYKTN